MKIVHEFFTYNKSRPGLAFALFFFVFFLSFSIPQTRGAFAASLPNKIGRLNDYGDVLTMEDQRKLEKTLTELEEKGIGLTILISRYDPYSDANIYASEIRRKWGISGDRDESLIVFVREGEDWKVRTYLRPQVTNSFEAGELAKYVDLLRKKVKNGEVRVAVMKAASRIHRSIFPPKAEKTGEKTGDGSQLWLYLTAGISGGVALLVGLLFWESRRRCPRCGSRLEKVEIGSNLGGSNTERHCPECGYHEE